MGFLDGLRVLDCTDERGLLAGRLLADLGADVVQVEGPDGSPARRLPPLRDGASMVWETYSANKRGVTCDLAHEAGRDRVRALAATADFFIESAGAGVLDGLGLGWEALSALNPRLIYVSITAFGVDGPKAAWPATDLTVWAAGGPLAYNRDEVGPPLRISVPQTWLHAAADAAGGALIAHHSRQRTGRGQRVEVSAQASLGLTTLGASLTAVTGDHEPNWIPRPGGLTIDQSGSGARTRRAKWAVSDGYVELHLSMGPAVGAFTNNLFAWMREEGAPLDPSISAWDWRALPQMIHSGGVTGEEMEDARAAVAAFLRPRTKSEVTAASIARKMLAVGINDVGDLLRSPQFAARHFFVSPAARSGGERPGVPLTMPGPWARCSAEAFAFRRRAPGPGEHDDEVDREWRLAATPVATPASGGPDPGSDTAAGAVGALAGLRVADMSWVVAGPVVGRALADFGATVVRVESSTRVETARHMGPFYGGRPGTEASALYHNCNAGKLGLALDLSKPEGRAVARDLAGWADVLIESYTPGRMAAWGLGWADLSAINPRLVMLSSSLMGLDGPQTGLAGFGNVGAAMSGFQHLVGWPDRPPLGPFGPYTDYVAPRLALVALLAALDARRRTGRGCYLDVAQVECGAWMLAPQIADCAAGGEAQGRCGNRDAVMTPHGVFPVRAGEAHGADHVAIAVRDDDDWVALAGAMGRPDLAIDPRYASAEGRRLDEAALEEAVGAWTVDRSAAYVERACLEAGVPAHRASTSTDVVADEQLAHRMHLIPLPHPLHGRVVVEGPRAVLSATPGRVASAAPVIGQDNRRVLDDLLGYSDAEIRDLQRKDVLT